MKTKKTKKKKWSWSSFLLGALVAALATFIIHETKKEVMAWRTTTTVSRGRNPASIGKAYDFSGLQGNLLNQAAKQRLLDGLNIHKDLQSNSIQLGNFVLLNEQNQKDFVCGLYNHVTLSFEAEGVAVSGEKPSLIIDAPCTVGGDIDSLAPIKIPYQKIKAQNPQSHDISLQQEDGAFIHIQSGNNSDSWPNQWSLTQINLTQDGSPSRILNINQQDIKGRINKPVLMNW
jgi:hypothetical protein